MSGKVYDIPPDYQFWPTKKNPELSEGTIRGLSDVRDIKDPNWYWIGMRFGIIRDGVQWMSPSQERFMKFRRSIKF